MARRRSPLANQPDWFRALLDASPDVYFRYELRPRRRFTYLSPSIQQLTGRAPAHFCDNHQHCLDLVVDEDRRALRHLIRAKRGRTTIVRIARGGVATPIELTTVPVIRGRQLVAIEGIVRAVLHAQTRVSMVAAAPEQQRLSALMFEVHDLLHRVLPPATTAAPDVSRVLRAGELALDLERHSVTDAGVPVSLTSREVMVLRYLLTRPGRVVTRQQLLTDVWGYRYTGDDRTVDVHMSRLRQKLPSLRARLVAVKHVGYRFDEDQLDRIAVG